MGAHLDANQAAQDVYNSGVFGISFHKEIEQLKADELMISHPLQNAMQGLIGGARDGQPWLIFGTARLTVLWCRRHQWNRIVQGSARFQGRLWAAAGANRV